MPHALRNIARAPDDIDVLEFALEWRINPREIRENWELRDLYWLKLVETAQNLAEPEVKRRQAERRERDARIRSKRKR